MNIVACEPTTVAEMKAAHLARRARLGLVAKPVAYPIKEIETVEAAAERKRQRDAEYFRLLSYGGPTTARFLEDGEPVPEAPRYGRDQLIRSFLEQHAIEWCDLTRAGRANARQRQELMWLLKRHTQMSFPQIGRLLHRDHSSVLHGVMAHQKRMDAKAAR